MPNFGQAQFERKTVLRGKNGQSLKCLTSTKKVEIDKSFFFLEKKVFF
jgi:hypothetical protein